MTLYDRVKSAWENATQENDWDFSDYTDEDVALDMLAYDADLEWWSPCGPTGSPWMNAPHGGRSHEEAQGLSEKLYPRPPGNL